MKFTITALTCMLLSGCGAQDEKNEAENYPTYDTTRTPAHMNDSTSSQDIQSEGDLRHNIDNERDRDLE